MIIDSSVIVAIAIREPERDWFEQVMVNAPIRRMSAGTWMELSAVAARRRLMSAEWLENVLGTHAIVIEPVSGDQARIGHAAYRRFGIGSGHQAGLNFGDCFSYALAKAMGEPLLFKGDDFTHTDVLKVIENE